MDLRPRQTFSKIPPRAWIQACQAGFLSRGLSSSPCLCLSSFSFFMLQTSTACLLCNTILYPVAVNAANTKLLVEYHASCRDKHKTTEPDSCVSPRAWKFLHTDNCARPSLGVFLGSPCIDIKIARLDSRSSWDGARRQIISLDAISGNFQGTLEETWVGVHGLPDLRQEKRTRMIGSSGFNGGPWIVNPCLRCQNCAKAQVAVDRRADCPLSGLHLLLSSALCQVHRHHHHHHLRFSHIEIRTCGCS